MESLYDHFQYLKNVNITELVQHTIITFILTKLTKT